MNGNPTVIGDWEKKKVAIHRKTRLNRVCQQKMANERRPRVKDMQTSKTVQMAQDVIEMLKKAKDKDEKNYL